MWESRATLPETWLGCRFHTVWKKSAAKAEQAVEESCLQPGPVRIFFGFPTGLKARVRQTSGPQKKQKIGVNYILSLVPETSRVAGLHMARSRGCQKKRKEKRIRWGEDDCAEQGEATNSATCRMRVTSASVALTLTPTLCHRLSCSASDTLKVELNTDSYELL